MVLVRPSSELILKLPMQIDYQCKPSYLLAMQYLSFLTHHLAEVFQIQILLIQTQKHKAIALQ
jgi:hypothetical protein